MKTFILSDESVNNYGFWLPLSGAQLDQFKKNPVMLWMHNRAWRGTKDEILPIGYWDNIRVENGKLLADAVFDESDEFAMSISEKVDNNVLRMASVGIRVIETSKDAKWIKPGQTTETPTKWALREASIVDIGSNNNALSLVFYDENDKMINLADGKTTLPLRLLEDKPDNLSNSINMKKLSQLLQLAEGASEEQLADAIQAILTENKNLKDAKIAVEQKLSDYEAKEKTARTNEAKSLLDAAVADGRIDADGRKTWENLFEKDHESAQATLAAIQKRPSVAGQLKDDNKLPERDTLAKLSWDELDKQGKLRLLKDKHADLYEEKFEQKFGKKPNK